MTLHLLLAIAAQKEALKKTEQLLREWLLEEIKRQQLDFKILCERMECKSHALTNYFSNGQTMNEKLMNQLILHIKMPATPQELGLRKRQPCWKNTKRKA